MLYHRHSLHLHLSILSLTFLIWLIPFSTDRTLDNSNGRYSRHQQTKKIENLEFKTEDFDLEELNTALKSTKLNKEPGPDLVRMELLRWLNKDNRKSLLELLNKWWRTKEAPSELFLARVVSIYKKGKLISVPTIDQFLFSVPFTKSI